MKYFKEMHKLVQEQKVLQPTFVKVHKGSATPQEVQQIKDSFSRSQALMKKILREEPQLAEQYIKMK